MVNNLTCLLHGDLVAPPAECWFLGAAKPHFPKSSASITIVLVNSGPVNPFRDNPKAKMPRSRQSQSGELCQSGQ